MRISLHGCHIIITALVLGFVSFFFWLLANSDHQDTVTETERMKACVAAGKSWIVTNPEEDSYTNYSCR